MVLKFAITIFRYHIIDLYFIHYLNKLINNKSEYS